MAARQHVFSLLATRMMERTTLIENDEDNSQENAHESAQWLSVRFRYGGEVSQATQPCFIRSLPDMIISGTAGNMLKILLFSTAIGKTPYSVSISGIPAL